MTKQTKQIKEHVFQAKQTTNGVRLLRYYSDNPGGSAYKATFVCDLDYTSMHMHVYTSVCTPQDNFNKDTGVKLALARAEKNDGFSIKIDKDVPVVNQILQSLIEMFIMNDESNFVKLPSYSVKHALSKLI